MANERFERSAASRRARILFRVACILVLVGACAAIALYRDPISRWIAVTLDLSADPDPIPVLALEKGPLQLEIEAEGEIVGLESIAVATPVTGAGALKLAWLAPEGTLVAPKEPLMRFDSTDMLLNLESQKNTLTDNLLQTKVDTGNQELSERSLAVDRSTAQMDYDYAVQTKPDDPTIFSQWEIINAQQDTEFAKSRIENLAAKANTQKRQDRSARQISTIARNRAQTEVDILENACSALDVRAPAQGLVVYRRDRRQDPNIGDSCQPGQVMIDLVNLDALQARVYVLEKEASGLEKGEPVIIHLDAIPGVEFHGEVQSVSSLASTIERNGVLKYFTCNVVIHDAREHLKSIRPGMTMRANIVLKKYDSCFIIPTNALDYDESGDKAYVYVKKADGFEKRAVKLGLGKHGQATILSGVADREVVALRNPFKTKKLSLPDFSKVSADAQSRRGGPGMGAQGMRMTGGGGPGRGR